MTQETLFAVFYETDEDVSVLRHVKVGSWSEELFCLPRTAFRTSFLRAPTRFQKQSSVFYGTEEVRFRTCSK